MNDELSNSIDNSCPSDCKGPGAPTKYKQYYALQALKLCKLGATDKELADFFEVVEDTVNEWKQRHPEFSVAIKKGKTLADAEVAERLYQRAMGFEHNSVEIKVVDKAIERVPIRKVYPPDTIAAIFWLKNRQRGKWSDKQTIELDFDRMTDDQLDLIIDRLKNQAKKSSE